MTAAAPAASPSVSARSHQQHPSSVSSWPLPDDPLPPSETGTVTKSSLEDEEAHAGGILPQAGGQVNHGQLNHPQESSSLSPPPPPITNKTVVPWWRTRKAKIAYGVGAALLVVLVILLVLGLLGYLRKVGPLASLNHSSEDSSAQQQAQQPTAVVPPNPLSTIPFLSDPFALPPGAATPPPSVAPVVPAATPTPTNLPTINAVSFGACGYLLLCSVIAICLLVELGDIAVDEGSVDQSRLR